MALFKSTILAQISGSIAGATFSHNRGGSYARARAMVSNPATTRQSEVRTAMAALSQMWRDSLTPAQRDAWNAWGSSVQVVNRVGDTISLSGIAAYQRVNMFRVSTLGLGPELDPPDGTGGPVGVTIPAYESAAMVNNPPAGLSLTLSAAATAAFGLVAYYSAPLSPGKRFFRGPYLGRVTQPATASATQMIDLDGLVPATPGAHIAFKLQLYNIATSLPIWTVYQEPLITVGP